MYNAAVSIITIQQLKPKVIIKKIKQFSLKHMRYMTTIFCIRLLYSGLAKMYMSK